MDGGTRSRLLTLLCLPQGTRLPLVGADAMSTRPEQAAEPQPRVRVVGIPVAYGIELFKNRAKERNEIAARLIAERRASLARLCAGWVPEEQPELAGFLTRLAAELAREPPVEIGAGA